MLWWPRTPGGGGAGGGDTALPARVPGRGARRVPGMLQASWAFVALRVDGVAPCAAFVGKAPGSLFCALKIHIESIFAASLLFLLDVVSPLLGLPWGFRFWCGTPEMWLR